MQSTNFSAYPKRAQRISGGDGFDAVRCRICSKDLRVINGRHLSTHGINRETYMHEYRLSPDKLSSKSFRINHSSRSDYRALNKKEWIAAIKIVYQRHGQVHAGFLQKHYPQLYQQGIWLLVTGMQLCVYRGSRQRICGYGRIGMTNELLAKYSSCVERAFHCTRHHS